MEKKTVSHFNENGVLCEMELLEGTVIKYKEDKAFGFVRMDDGTEFFFHSNNRACMDAYGVEKLRFIPRFQRRSGQNLIEATVGNKILFVLGTDRKGRVCVGAWTYPLEYDEALTLCEKYKELEIERIERNPKFKCMQIVRRTGQKASTPSVRFQGTKQEFERMFPFRGKLNTSDTLLTQQLGDVEYLRWFERETLAGWEPCEDPRTIKLLLDLNKAREILWACDRTVDRDAWEVKWNAATRNLTFVVDKTHPLIAVGTSSGDTRQIKFVESPDYLETIFVSTKSGFQSLWDAGHRVETPTVCGK